MKAAPGPTAGTRTDKGPGGPRALLPRGGPDLCEGSPRAPPHPGVQPAAPRPRQALGFPQAAAPTPPFRARPRVARTAALLTGARALTRRQPPRPALSLSFPAPPAPRSSPRAAVSRGRTGGRRGRARGCGVGLRLVTWSRRAGAGLVRTEAGGSGLRVLGVARGRGVRGAATRGRSFSKAAQGSAEWRRFPPLGDRASPHLAQSKAHGGAERMNGRECLDVRVASCKPIFSFLPRALPRFVPHSFVPCLSPFPRITSLFIPSLIYSRRSFLIPFSRSFILIPSFIPFLLPSLTHSLPPSLSPVN